MRNTSYCELWGNMSRDRWVVNIMQIRHAGDLLLISCPNLIKISCFKGLRWKIYVKEDLATENENIENRKINEQHKFSLDADFVWILQKRNSFKYGYGMLNAHIASEIIFLHRTFIFCIAKNNEKRKENKI